ncbi:Crp/Fnr family transcriptional regulator [Labrenzia sp. 011]|uniref:Crp/Fnr family transcriptional regulator n=1 Tax=Labrenzia sp. 011 TaxID=2171494 RepID=UPI00197BF816|nr:Crp/Fnr family transcriptional regulator [Labrenzia sp. 011]
MIRATRPEAQAFLAARMETRQLEAGCVLYDKSQGFTHAIFPHAGILSLMSEMSEGRSVEKTSIGNEGFLGFTYPMGGLISTSRTVVRVPGYASWLAMSDLDEAMQRFVCVRDVMLGYSRAQVIQLMETVACNALHSAEQRVSRWLLHAYDRQDGEDFPLTQKAISEVLGMRRATISQACSVLLKSGAITYSRGKVSILNRNILQRHACDCYERVTAASLPR